ncbi:MAG TPA: hypothetical protein VHA12_03730 [Candidatus Nanoarchaeia archaeon]|nr:hypothetical protein [Candidatus Nanoarchaeia archaeon]
MVVKKKQAKEVKKSKPSKVVKPSKVLTKKAQKEEEEEHSGGASLDDAFGDDEDVSYAEAKPKKEKKKKVDEDEELDDEVEDELDEIQHAENSVERGEIEINQSKPVSKIKKGDKIKIDGVEYEVDAHYVLIDHGTTKEMTIEIFDPKRDKDFQLRYFDDQLEATLDLYELQEILYIKRAFKKVEW